MMHHIENVLVIVNHLKAEACEMLESVRNYLQDRNITVTVKQVENDDQIDDFENIDLAISLGGDGTVLYSSRVLSNRKIPILAVNLGDFGFITEVSQYEWIDAFEKYQKGYLGISKRIMLDVVLIRDGKKILCWNGLNDAVVGAAGTSKIIRLDVHLSKTPVGEYRADGVIISTPTGSTAYSAAAGGPILAPEMEAMILNPICPFTLSNRPLVVPGGEIINITVKEHQRTDVLLTVDGQYAQQLQPEDTISVKMSEKYALIIRSDKRNFYEVLRKKLNWSGGPDA